jgi:hypothetical protein
MIVFFGVRMALKMLFASPITKIGESKLLLSVVFFAELTKSSLRILDSDSPLLELGFPINELLLS